jgi:hypothetical protein
MFGWFRPTCPCDDEAKAWIEKRLIWLSEQFPHNAYNGRKIVMPTHDFFPEPYDGTKKAARALLNRVCTYMDVDPDVVMLRFFSNAKHVWMVNESGQYHAPAAGTFEELTYESRRRRKEDEEDVPGPSGDNGKANYMVRLDKHSLEDAMGLVGTLAHELAHVRLLGERRISQSAFDNELLTDLTVVFHGLGVFLANTPRNWDSGYSKRWPKSELRKPEYMTPPMFGYALAHLAWFQQEAKPAWSKHLHWNAWPSFRAGVRYLFKTGRTRFQPEHYGPRGEAEEI